MIKNTQIDKGEKQYNSTTHECRLARTTTTIDLLVTVLQ